MRKAPLSITTAPERPYDDAFGPDGLLRYRYRGVDRDHPDNRGLRTAMQLGLPLIYFHGVARGRYAVAWPVFVVGDNPEDLSFTVAVDDSRGAGPGLRDAAQGSSDDYDATPARRAYVTATVRVRLHQRAFRERVLDAYRHRCAFCRFHHEELLNAAHIIPDPEPQGEPVVPNGVALCSLHHAAFDHFFLGLRPDYIIQVRPDLLREEDGPTLEHAIQGLHGKRITLPPRVSLRPDQALLGRRFDRFTSLVTGDR
jgi:putative restriction endonuclease